MQGVFRRTKVKRFFYLFTSKSKHIILNEDQMMKACWKANLSGLKQRLCSKLFTSGCRTFEKIEGIP